MKIRLKKVLALYLVFALLIFAPPPVFAVTYSDTAGHWAKTAIERWSELGILKGSNGMFRPNDPVTRGELAAILNRVLGFPQTDEEFFTDAAGKWYEDDVNACAKQEVYIVNSGMCLGDAALTREEAAEMFFRAFPVRLSNMKLTKTFGDESEISDSYRFSTKAMLNMGFVNGYPDGTFHPKETFTRAQVVTILNNIIEVYITEPGIYEQPLGKRVCIASPDVTLREQELEYLFVAPSSMGGTIIFENGSADYGTYWLYENKASSEFAVSGVLRQNIYVCDIKQKPVDYAAQFAGGLGTEADPYLIATAEQLALLNKFAAPAFSSTFFRLKNNIMLTGKWLPISFYGTFDGNGYEIHGIDINVSDKSTPYIGMFEYLFGTVKNLTVSGEIQAEDTQDNVWLYIGGIAGYATAGARIENCTVSGKIQVEDTRDNVWLYIGGVAGNAASIQIKNCSSQIEIVASCRARLSAGGLVGLMSTSVAEDCRFFGSINITSKIFGCDAGGVAGRVVAKSSLSNCISDGIVKAMSGSTEEDRSAEAGGIAGCVTGSAIENCYSAASVTAAGGYYTFSGGIAGILTQYDDEVAPRDAGSTANGCFAEGLVHAEGARMQNNVGGAFGQIFGSGEKVSSATACGAAATVTAEGNPGWFSAVGGFAGSIYGNASATNCYSAGSASCPGSTSIAGFVGRMEGSLNNCYTVTKVTAQSSLGNLPTQGLIGTVRTDVIVTNCGSFIDSNLYFYDNVNYKQGKTTPITAAELKKSRTYI